MTDEAMADKYAFENRESCMYDDRIGWETDHVARKQAFLAGIEAGRSKWHKVADGDLPKGNCENILLYNKDHFCVTHSYSLGYYENGVFYNDCEMEEDTIAWRKIPRYKEE